jgi:DNA-directed RNA polymerase subunit RPC12/RpoP
MKQREFKCPHCKAALLSRIAKVCAQCKKPLPPELLLSDDQVKSLEDETKKIRTRAEEMKPKYADPD